MAHSATAVANYFLKLSRESGSPLSNMKLQKMVYFAHGYALAILDRSLISTENAEAWQFGPVYPELYKQLRKYGAGEVTGFLQCQDRIPEDSKFAEIIRAVWNAAKRISESQLSARTRAAGSPWSHARKLAESSKIPDEQIKAYFKQSISERCLPQNH